MSDQFVGIWNIEIDAPIGKQRVRLEIADNAGAIAGTATQGSETVPFHDVVRDGDGLQWSQSVTKPMKLTVKFAVSCSGDEMTGTAKAGIFPKAKLSGRRER